MKELKVLTYNVDELPEKLDLKELPWLLKPIGWIYKLIKGTSFIKINDNPDNHSYEIGGYLLKTNPDIAVLQEDFNYHRELMLVLEEEYNDSTHTGKIDFSNIKWFPRPRFKADGLNLIYKKKSINTFSEDIIKWNKSYGYISHANDLLTTKGFRFYNAIIDNLYLIKIYILHMDADFYNSDSPNIKGDLEARKSQFKQIVNHIKKEYNKHSPMLIIGDTNSYDKYEWDKNNIETNLIHEINHISGLTIKEAVPTNHSDCDKIFYINDEKASFNIELKECHFDMDINYSDHKPLIATFNLVV